MGNWVVGPEVVSDFSLAFLAKGYAATSKSNRLESPVEIPQILAAWSDTAATVLLVNAER